MTDDERFAEIEQLVGDSEPRRRLAALLLRAMLAGYLCALAELGES